MPVYFPAYAGKKKKKSIGYGRPHLRICLKDAVLVNTARKEVIDEDGLLKIFGGSARYKLSLPMVAPENKATLERSA